MLSIRGSEWYRVTARQTEDGSHLIVFSDMTEFVDRGLKLKESEARFERLAEHLPGAILRRLELAKTAASSSTTGTAASMIDRTGGGPFRR